MFQISKGSTLLTKDRSSPTTASTVFIYLHDFSHRISHLSHFSVSSDCVRYDTLINVELTISDSSHHNAIVYQDSWYCFADSLRNNTKLQLLLPDKYAYRPSFDNPFSSIVDSSELRIWTYTDEDEAIDIYFDYKVKLSDPYERLFKPETPQNIFTQWYKSQVYNPFCNKQPGWILHI